MSGAFALHLRLPCVPDHARKAKIAGKTEPHPSGSPVFLPALRFFAPWGGNAGSEGVAGLHVGEAAQIRGCGCTDVVGLDFGGGVFGPVEYVHDPDGE